MYKVTILLGFAMAALIAGTPSHSNEKSSNTNLDRSNNMELGVFSVSLAVKDLAASRDFYAKLGFDIVGGDATQNWLVLSNGTVTIGLFQGMFEGNILTFNPGWNSKKEALDSFTDIRQLQANLKKAGLTLQTEADEQGTGPASFTLIDPDGNAILVDQHTSRPSE